MLVTSLFPELLLAVERLQSLLICSLPIGGLLSNDYERICFCLILGLAFAIHWARTNLLVAFFESPVSSH